MKIKAALPLLIILLGFLPVPADADFLRIDEYKAALKTDPQDHIAHYGLGRAYRQMGLYEEAIKEFEEVLKLEPLFPAAVRRGFKTGAAVPGGTLRDRRKPQVSEALQSGGEGVSRGHPTGPQLSGSPVRIGQHLPHHAAVFGGGRSFERSHPAEPEPQRTLFCLGANLCRAGEPQARHRSIRKSA